MGSTKEDVSTKGQRLAKNSLFIYLRMLIIMVVTLYTSRVVLEALGVTDFGIYNVVAGIVTFLSFFNVSLVNAIQRYLNMGLAQENPELTRKYFDQCMTLYLWFLIVFFVLGETVGSWFVLKKLVIPPDRLQAAFWAYQFALVYGIINVIQIPYMGVLIAREKMSVYAYMAFLETGLKLLCVYLLLLCPGPTRLPLYSAFLAGCMGIYTLVYVIYCRRYPETKLKYVWDKELVKEMGRFIGMTLFGSLAWLVGTQGTNILLNLFFGPVVNASRGIALQVSGTITRFTDSILTAVKPQIVQSYAQNELGYMHSLIHKGSVFSFIFMAMISAPLLLNIDKVLSLWLVDVPEYSGVFTQLVVMELLVWTLQNPLSIAANATGNLKRTQVTGRILLMLSVPLSYLLLKIWDIPSLAFISLIFTATIFLIYSIYDIHIQIGLMYSGYFKSVIKPIIITVTPLLGAILTVNSVMEEGILRILVDSCLSVLIVVPIVYFYVMGKQEQAYVRKMLKKTPLGRLIKQ
ncbi:MAG: oligosaccharide flippase family protein [Muribaculaceae bacterium]|nr:oligosaccharide flippase family protein [Muribaculaceae bacterium]